MAWYNDKKLETVGWLRGESNSAKLSHYCRTMPIHAQDRIIAMKMVTNPDGVESISY